MRKAPVASLHDYATAPFEPLAADAARTLLPEQVIEHVMQDATVFRVASKLLQRDPAGMQAFAAGAGEDALADVLDNLGRVAVRYQALAEMLRSAELRLLAGASRHVVAQGLN